MRVVHQGVTQTGRCHHLGKGRGPDSLGQPEALGVNLEFFRQVLVRQANLADGVLFGNKGEQGFVESPAEEFDLVPVRKSPQPIREIRPILLQPFQKVAAVVERNPESRVFFQHLEERVIALFPA